VCTACGDKTVIRDLSAEVSALEPLLVQGPSGTGKTSLMRALAGIWREGSGKVNRPALSEVMFLPQRPYLILGSLRDQLTYPRAPVASDQQQHEILEAVNLSDLPERFGGLDVEMHWAARSRRESSSAWHSRVYFSTIRAMHFSTKQPVRSTFPTSN
jgi:putative ATP-binding cassette transporter